MKTAQLLLLATAVLASGKGANSDPSVTWTLYSGYMPMAGQPSTGPTLMQPCDPATVSGCTASALTGDGALYSNGINGVSNCVIHVSGTNPTYDATLGLSAPRSISFNLHHQVAASGTAPSWATSTVTGAGFLNIPHILQNNTLGSPVESDYSTRLTSLLPVSGTYHLRMHNPSATQPVWSNSSDTFNYNSPYTTALVNVHHCPDTRSGYSSAACPANHKESWYFYPDAGTQTNPQLAPVTQVSTLVSESTKGGTTTITEIGQYSTPFFFKIELQ